MLIIAVLKLYPDLGLELALELGAGVVVEVVLEQVAAVVVAVVVAIAAALRLLLETPMPRIIATKISSVNSRVLSAQQPYASLTNVLISILASIIRR